MLKATEMDFLRKAANRTKMQRITSDRIREIMKVTRITVDGIKDLKLIWFGHIERLRNRFCNRSRVEGANGESSEKAGRVT